MLHVDDACYGHDQVVRVSQSQAQQRSGRAGREAPGSCYRLYTEPSYSSMLPATTPEIQRVDLCQVVLQLKVIGIDKVQCFAYLSPPSKTALIAAMELLYMLGALDTSGQLTAHGKRMAALPLSPVFAHLVLTSTEGALVLLGGAGCSLLSVSRQCVLLSSWD